MVGSRASFRQGRSFAAAAAIALLLLPGRASADRRDQRAADLYSEGVKLIRQGRYREGAAKVNAALARGATEPVEAQGSETRFQARPYDPYYWLGVAQMETGLPEQALANFEKSSTLVPKGRSKPVLADAPEEWADLARRKALLLARLEVPTPAALVVAAPTVLPSPLPTALAIRLPERTAAPVPEPTVRVALATPATGPTRAPLPASLAVLRADLVLLLAEPSFSVRAGEAARAYVTRVDATSVRGTSVAAGVEAALRRELSGRAGEPLVKAALAAALEAHRERRFEEAARLASVAGRLAPSSAPPRLLRAIALGTRWLLEGEARPGLESEARAAFSAWRALRPPGSPDPRFLSPQLRDRLGSPAPAPSRG